MRNLVCECTIAATMKRGMLGAFRTVGGLRETAGAKETLPLPLDSRLGLALNIFQRVFVFGNQTAFFFWERKSLDPNQGCIFY